MTLCEFLKLFIEWDENILLRFACGKVYEGMTSGIPALYIFRPYTVKKGEGRLGQFSPCR